MRGPVKPTVSPRGLTMGSIKTIKNTNNFSIFNWIPRSSRGMTLEKLIHATMPCEKRSDVAISSNFLRLPRPLQSLAMTLRIKSPCHLILL
nr:hypothetical protein [Rickettsia monacensis]